MIVLFLYFFDKYTEYNTGSCDIAIKMMTIYLHC